MARPSKNEGERRSRHVIFRLTEAEYEALCAVAARAGLAPNELGRRLIRRGQRRLVIVTHKRCDPAFLKRLDQLGNNLNQVAKNSHIFGRLSPRLEELCERIDRLVTQAIEEDSDGA